MGLHPKRSCQCRLHLGRFVESSAVADDCGIVTVLSGLFRLSPDYSGSVRTIQQTQLQRQAQNLWIGFRVLQQERPRSEPTLSLPARKQTPDSFLYAPVSVTLSKGFTAIVVTPPEGRESEGGLSNCVCRCTCHLSAGNGTDSGPGSATIGYGSSWSSRYATSAGTQNTAPNSDHQGAHRKACFHRRKLGLDAPFQLSLFSNESLFSWGNFVVGRRKSS